MAVDARVHDGGACTVEVSNDGPAIASEHQARIFDRLYRIDPSRGDSAAGAGLGRAIVKSIMDLHGGNITVESRIHRGSVFTITIPHLEAGETPALPPVTDVNNAAAAAKPVYDKPKAT